MQFHVAEFTDSGIKSITLSHGSDSMTWETRPYARASRIDGSKAQVNLTDDMVFREINSFLQTLPEERQKAIWDAYVDIYQLFEANFDPMAIQGRMQANIKRIYDQIPYEELYEWAKFSSHIRLPIGLKAEYGDNDPVELTYLRQDYFELAVLAIASRPMVPIWGEYIPRIKDDAGTNFKEYFAVKLLYRTYITSCQPYQRLRVYIEASIGSKSKQGNLFSAVLAGLSSAEIPDWLLASTLVRRTSVVPISAESEGPNIITDVYQYVSNTLRSPGHRRFSGPISPKQVRKDEKADQQESLAESYKIKQEVSDGDVVMANIFTQNTVGIAQAMDPTVDLEKLRVCEESIQVLENQPIMQHQLVLTQWVLAAAISMRYIPLLAKPALLRAMAVAQALLWHWGFNDLASLLTAREVKQDQDEFISSQETWSKIPKELMEKLVAIYPYPYPVKGKNVTPRQANPGSRAVDGLYELIYGSDWYLYAPRALVAVTNRIPGMRKMYVPTDIRIQLANLLIHLYQQRLDYAERSPLKAYPLS